MKLYLVRHGESESNVERRYENGESRLSPLGVWQAEQLARRFSNIPVDVVFASDYVRAHETAKIVNIQLQKELVISDLLRERKYPTAIVGRYGYEPEVGAVLASMFRASDPAWRHSDEESLADMKERAKKAIDFISRRPEENILAVSHGTFMRMMLAVMEEKAHTFDTFSYLHYFFKTANTGITICENINGAWSLRTWNDHAHLTESTTV